MLAFCGAGIPAILLLPTRDRSRRGELTGFRSDSFAFAGEIELMPGRRHFQKIHG
jgi:hypothetical protein